MIMMKMAQHGVTEIIHMKRYTCISLVALWHSKTKTLQLNRKLKLYVECIGNLRTVLL